VFAFHVGCISLVRSVRFKILLPSFLITFLLPDTFHVPLHCHELGCPVYCLEWFCRILLSLFFWRCFGQDSDITFRRLTLSTCLGKMAEGPTLLGSLDKADAHHYT
jgi:hypothetical protein